MSVHLMRPRAFSRLGTYSRRRIAVVAPGRRLNSKFAPRSAPAQRPDPTGKLLFSRFLDPRREAAAASRKIEKVGWQLIEVGKDFGC